jgi:outer membrane protein TolC
MARTGWGLGLWVVLLPVGWAGCSYHCFTDCTSCPNGALPSGLAAVADCVDVPPTACGPVSTVCNPEGDKRLISLCECIAIALEKGRVGTNIRVLAFNPAIAQTDVEQSLAQFDARFRASMLWNDIDEKTGGSPLFSPAALVGTLGAGIQGAAAGVPAQEALPFFQSQQATLQTQLLKPLPTGGVAGITFQTDYEKNNLNEQTQTFNPSYLPRLIFTFEQPLLRGAGVEVNQTGILVSRLGLDQAHTAFTASVNDLLFNVEQAYWTLYSAYWNLYTQDLALRQSQEAWQVGKYLFDKNQLPIQNLSLLEATYQSFRLARLDALQAVLEAERQLRLTVGLPTEDGHRLIPTDQPTAAPYRPDWHTALCEALENRPELVQARQDITRIQVLIKQAKNQILPDLRFVASYDFNGMGNRLDGSTDGINDNALKSMTSNRFHDWTLGLTLDVPIGARAAHAQLRRTQLQLEQRQVQLHDQEAQAAFALQRSYRELLQRYERIQIVSAVRRSATTQFQALYEEYRRGQGLLQFLLQAQQTWLVALRDEQLAVLAYNVALADFEREKGTIMRCDNVSIADGPLPACVQARASEHIHEREQAYLLRNRPLPCNGEACPGGATDPSAEMVPLLTNGPPSVPALLEKAEKLPAPTDSSPAGPTSLSTPARPGKKQTAPGQ